MKCTYFTRFSPTIHPLHNANAMACAAKISHVSDVHDSSIFVCRRSLVSFTLEKFGKLDFLVNNGGGQFPCGAADMSLKGIS